MSSERAKKSRVRGGHKAAVTRRIKDVDDTIAAATPGSPLDLTKLATLRISLREKLDALSKLDEEIFELIEDETKLAADIETADAFKMSIHATIMKIDEHGKAQRERSTCGIRYSHCTSTNLVQHSIAQTTASFF